MKGQFFKGVILVTLENYAYRTDPMFLRNQFPSKSQYGIPTVPKAKLYHSELLNPQFIAFNQAGRD